MANTAHLRLSRRPRSLVGTHLPRLVESIEPRQRVAQDDPHPEGRPRPDPAGRGRCCGCTHGLEHRRRPVPAPRRRTPAPVFHSGISALARSQDCLVHVRSPRPSSARRQPLARNTNLRLSRLGENMVWLLGRLRLSVLAQERRLRRRGRAAGGAGAPSSRTHDNSKTSPPVGRDVTTMVGLGAARVGDLRVVDPLDQYLHDGLRHQGRCASQRDGLRPPWTPKPDEQAGWLSGRCLSSGRAKPRTPGAPRTPGEAHSTQRGGACQMSPSTPGKPSQ